MSIISIIPEDRVASVDGIAVIFDFVINPNVHAVQWDDVLEEGHEEFKDGQQNKPLNNFNPYDHILVEREQAIIDQAAEKAAEEAAKEAELEAARLQEEQDYQDYLLGLTPQERRDREYPPEAEQLAALHYARKGDPAPLAAIDTEMDAVDALYPL
jgi:hypothetical protein